MQRAQTDASKAIAQHVTERLSGRPIVLIGMMGAGKTTVGRRVAARLGLNFVDSDAEIERAANMTIPEIFETHGEEDFRTGEARVIARLLKDGQSVIGTGGGAFINPDTRALIAENAISVWLKADLDLLFERVSRRSNRPLLKTSDPKKTLKELIDRRYPVYALADITVVSRDEPHDLIAADVIAAVDAFLSPDAAKDDTADAR
ncbi:MAG TPA: shikimate kinase [Devosiaceae bacterium]